MMSLERVNLGNSSLLVPRIGFGCEQLGEHGWGEVVGDDIVSAIHAALDTGGCLFDTADCYGLGLSEERLGETVKHRRHDAVIATKFSVRFDNDGNTFYDNSTKWIDQALDGSLRRLKTDYIDLYQVHYHDGKTPLQQTLNYLELKREQGKIRFYGVTNVDLRTACLDETPPGFVSFSDDYSLAKRGLEERINAGIDLGFTFISHGSLGQGILTGKYSGRELLAKDDRRHRRDYGNFHGSSLKQNLALVSRMRSLLNRYPGATLAQMGCRWILDTLEGSIALVGIKSVTQWADAQASLEWQIDAEDLAELAALSAANSNLD